MKLTYEEAKNKLIDSVSVTTAETVDLEKSYGRVLAEDIAAAENVPSFDRSPYDGYAFRAEDTAIADDMIDGHGSAVAISENVPGIGTDRSSECSGVVLRVIENIRAGQLPEKKVVPGTAVRLMTGACLPEGADAICKYEDTDFTDTEVVLKRKYKTGENVICAGEDMKKGQFIARAGTVIDAGLAGAMASLGIISVPVYKRLRTGLISTGDEVAELGEELKKGQIRNSNRYSISAALEKYNIDTLYLGHVDDDEESIIRMIERGLRECDVLISTGGVSVGDYDLVISAMKKAGLDILCDGVVIKPGMASAYGVKEGKLMLALSGNPASSLTNLQCVCMPALRKMAGYLDYDHRLVDMRISEGYTNKSSNTRFLRGKLGYRDGEVWLEYSSSQGNVVISSAIGCDAYGIIPPKSGQILEGKMIKGFLI